MWQFNFNPKGTAFNRRPFRAKSKLNLQYNIVELL
jgi:hypothetical protein